MKLPPLPEELFEFYPSMSAQSHQHHIEQYARAAVKSAEAGIIRRCADEIEVLEKSLVAACNRSFNAGDQGSAIIERFQSDGIKAAIALLRSKADAA
jgi:hypothetical protein